MWAWYVSNNEAGQSATLMPSMTQINSVNGAKLLCRIWYTGFRGMLASVSMPMQSFFFRAHNTWPRQERSWHGAIAQHRLSLCMRQWPDKSPMPMVIAWCVFFIWSGVTHGSSVIPIIEWCVAFFQATRYWNLKRVFFLLYKNQVPVNVGSLQQCFTKSH